MFEISPYRQLLTVFVEHVSLLFTDVSVLMDVKGKNLPCQIADDFLCPCLFGKRRLSKRAMRRMVTAAYQQSCGSEPLLKYGLNLQLHDRVETVGTGMCNT